MKRNNNSFLISLSAWRNEFIFINKFKLTYIFHFKFRSSVNNWGIILEFTIRLSRILILNLHDGNARRSITRERSITPSANRHSTSNSPTRVSIKYSRCASFRSIPPQNLNLSNSCR